MVKSREEMVRLTRLNLNGTVFKEDLFQIPQTSNLFSKIWFDASSEFVAFY